MENATKALLIAGAILIAILLIAMGVKVLNSTKSTTDSVDTTMDVTAVAAFNNKFTPYLGNNKSKAQAMAAINTIIANNGSNTRQVTITLRNLGSTEGATSAGKLNTIASQSDDAKFYIFVDGYSLGENNGYITGITISKLYQQ